jgi:Tat protein secretion system quality control protein TatD with DNase activity
VKESLRRTPLDQLLFETDFPDQSWGDFVNEPALVREVYEGAGRILGVPLEVLLEKTNANFAKIG